MVLLRAWGMVMTVWGANQSIASVLAVYVSFSTLFTQAHQRFRTSRLRSLSEPPTPELVSGFAAGGRELEVCGIWPVF